MSVELADRLTCRYGSEVTVVALTNNPERVWVVESATLAAEYGMVNGNARLIDIREYAVIQQGNNLEPW